MSTLLLLYLLAFCRVAIALLFVASLAGKITNVALFEKTIAGFSILPPQASKPAAFLFLAGEAIVVVLVAAGGPLLGLGFLLAIVMLLVFSGALISVLWRKVRTSCNCFGATDQPVSPFDVWRNAGLIVCALGGLQAFVALRGEQGNLSIIEWGLIGLGAALFVAVWINLKEIVQLFRQS